MKDFRFFKSAFLIWYSAYFVSYSASFYSDRVEKGEDYGEKERFDKK